MTTKNKKLALLRTIFSYFGRLGFPARRRWARIIGWVAPRLARSRAQIVRTNLALAFPELSASERERLLQEHFHLLAQSLVDRGVCWFGTTESVVDTIEISGLEHLDELLKAERRIILLAPHFIGLDAAATRLTLFLKESATMYTRQSDVVVDQLVREGRARFNTVHLVSRHDGVRGLIRQLRNGVPIYYLPDMDWGMSGAAFVPFFGVQAATLLTTAQIARNFDAAVVPIMSRLDTGTGKYHVTVMPPLEDFPGDQDLEKATGRINELIEEWIKPDPAQYYWVHRRYKTRPEGEARFY